VALLEVEGLSVWFHTRNGVVRAVEDVSFTLDAGETLAIVGESGSGKSVCCYSLLGLVPMPPGRIESGSARFAGRDLLRLAPRQLRAVRGNQIATIFQDPMTCLNPFLTLGDQLMEPLRQHRRIGRRAARARALELLEEVGIADAERRFDAYPHEFSGGMRQRVMIAMALIAEPKLLIADEPTTALDVTVQAQILRLIAEIQARRNLAVLFVSHDLAVVAGIADRILVMQDGRVVERGAPGALFRDPQHPYTRKLLAASRRGHKAAPPPPQREPVIEVEGLRTWFRAAGGRIVKAVDEVSLTLYRNEVLGVVGESGSGKSTLGRSILQLVKPTAGSVRLRGTELTTLGERALRPLRRHLQMIFQDPYASLDPRMSVFDALAEPLRYHRLAGRREVTAKVLALMDDVGLPRAAIRKYPHEFSGGQRQRIAIGRALATRPEVVIADEPVSALDVTIQAQILDLILALVARHNLSLIFISHDLAVVRYLCDRVLVLHRGKLVESGATEELWAAPQAAYTRELLAAAPRLD